MTPTLTDNLEAVQVSLSDVEHEALILARSLDDPDAWAVWSDTAAALAAVRAALGRGIRGNGYRPPRKDAS